MNYSIDRPPLFTARNQAAWADVERLNELGVLKALGPRHLRDSALMLLDKANGGGELSIREGDRLSRIILRLSDLWVRFTDEEREEFYHVFLDTESQPVIKRPDLETKALTVEIPEGMDAMRIRGWTPHLYQRRAVQFAIDHERVLLALEMGLGKTLIALLAIHHLIDRGAINRVIVTAPASAHNSWTDHLTMSDRKIEVISGRAPVEREAIYTQLYHGEIDGVIVTPQTFSNDYKYFHTICALDHVKALVVADEVHKFKGRGKTAASFEAISKLAARVIGMTGTPKPNKVEDFYSVVHRIAPDVLGEFSTFAKEYTYPQFDHFSSVHGVRYEAGALRADRLNDLYFKLRRILFVRTATDPDALLNLPPREDKAPFIPPEPAQRDLMRALIDMQAARELNASKYQEALAGRRGFLEQVAAEGATATAQALGIRIEQLVITPAIFSETFAVQYPKYESPKVRYVAEAVMHHLTDPEAAAVVFCEFIGGLTAIYHALVRRGINREQIDIYSGSNNRAQRADMERRLNEGISRVLIGQTKSLETGANLQKRANFVAHLNTPWAPDTLTQSTARVYRQGQKKPVIVLRPSGCRLEEVKNKSITRKLITGAGLVGALYDADHAVLTTSADERVRKAQALMVQTNRYTYDMIQSLCEV